MSDLLLVVVLVVVIAAFEVMVFRFGQIVGETNVYREWAEFMRTGTPPEWMRK